MRTSSLLSTPTYGWSPHRRRGIRGILLARTRDQHTTTLLSTSLLPSPLRYIEDDARHEVESADSPPICVPPHCYPHKSDQHVHDEHGIEVVDETPPICVPPHCYPHTTPDVPLEAHDQTDLARPETEQQGIHDQYESPPICMPPHCYPHTQEDDPHILVDQNQSGSLKVEYTVVELQPDEAEEKPICMPPICVPPAKSPPVCVPPSCVPDIEEH